MATVANILTAKGHVVHGVGPQETVHRAVLRMVEQNVGSLLVVARDGRPLGIVTERDCLRRIVLEDRRSKETSVETIMTLPVQTVSLGTSVEHCMRTMTDLRVRHLAVLDGNALVGVVSIGDIVKMQTLEHRSSIEQMTHYIQGRA